MREKIKKIKELSKEEVFGQRRNLVFVRGLRNFPAALKIAEKEGLEIAGKRRVYMMMKKKRKCYVWTLYVKNTPQAQRVLRKLRKYLDNRFTAKSYQVALNRLMEASHEDR